MDESQEIALIETHDIALLDAHGTGASPCLGLNTPAQPSWCVPKVPRMLYIAAKIKFKLPELVFAHFCTNGEIPWEFLHPYHPHWSCTSVEIPGILFHWCKKTKNHKNQKIRK